ncbi:MAG: hypothetical protein ACTSRZ_00495 [Promethearchaeota archaeon]
MDFILQRSIQRNIKKEENISIFLCLYYKDDSHKYELAKKYRNNKNVKYRYWKSNEDTLKGKYSKQFLEQLSPKERKKWSMCKI